MMENQSEQFLAKHIEQFLAKCKVRPASAPNVTKRESSSEGIDRLMAMFEDKQFDELLLLIDSISRDPSQSSISQLPHFNISMCLLVAEVRLRSGHGDDAFAQMIALKDTIEYKSSFIWKWRVDMSVINAAIRLRLYVLAIEELTKTHELIYSKISSYPMESQVKLNLINADVSVLCRLGRLLLQTGSLHLAVHYEAIAIQFIQENTLEEITVNRILNLQGLVLFANDKFEEAISKFHAIIASQFFTKSTKVQPELLFDLNAEDIDFYTCVCQLDEDIFPSAANNYAVCAMHLGKVREAVELLESVIQQDPYSHLVDPIVFNLCTMYDISYAVNVSEIKKKTLKCIADMYYVTDSSLNAKSFRPTNS